MDASEPHETTPTPTPTPTTLSLTANGLRFHVVAAGPADGPLLLLLHGFPEFSYAWRHQLRPLAALGYRVVAPDQRGYGDSDKPSGSASYRLDVLADDVVALAAAIGHDTFSLVGHDWGGIVAWRVASDHPDRVERIAILNAPNLDIVSRHLLKSPSQLVKSTYVALFQLPWLPERMLSAMNYALLAGALTSSSRPGTFGVDELASYRDAWSRPGALTAMLDWYRALPGLPRRAPVRIRAPTLIVWGDRDGALDASLAEDSLALCDRGRVRHIADATHWVHHERVVEVNDLLSSFLRRGA